MPTIMSITPRRYAIAPVGKSNIIKSGIFDQARNSIMRNKKRHLNLFFAPFLVIIFCIGITFQIAAIKLAGGFLRPKEIETVFERYQKMTSTIAGADEFFNASIAIRRGFVSNIAYLCLVGILAFYISFLTRRLASREAGIFYKYHKSGYGRIRAPAIS